MKFLKATYAANILYISSMIFSEISVLLLLRMITPSERDRKLIACAGSIAILWFIVAFVVSAAECGSPEPWNFMDGHCLNRVSSWTKSKPVNCEKYRTNYKMSWWTCVEVMNILINLSLIAVPAFIIKELQMSIWRKLSINGMFAVRLMLASSCFWTFKCSTADGHFSVCAASVCKLVYWNRVGHSADSTFAIWPVSLCTQTIQCASITSFSLLYFKPLLEALESGFMRSDDLRRKGLNDTEGNYDLSLFGATDRNNAASRYERTRQNTSTKTVVTSHSRRPGMDTDSQHSHVPIIKKTRLWAVERLPPTDLTTWVMLILIGDLWE